ncbi:hypothetical protein DXG03_003767 [Asterophora parasitica]|uniref:Uncharacterized protein n=1 Tax=Asterophora parasitica TaxID=117018 RepID=A0A9P7G398_9AGAR|nr:hypothetical protein DXG03_003767 [Asterophora parasitica]
MRALDDECGAGYSFGRLRTASIGSLYMAGFAQAGPPHAGLIIVSNDKAGDFVHIRISEGVWKLDTRQQNIVQSISLTTLLKIHDVSAGAITRAQLQEAAQHVPVPSGGESGECLPWVLRVVERLDAMGLVNLSSSAELGEEFTTFSAGNRSYAQRDKYPNVKTSAHCT